MVSEVSVVRHFESFLLVSVGRQCPGGETECLKVLMKPSENELWPDLAFSGCGWKIYGELWKPDAASLGRMSPTHASFFVPFWNLIWTLVWTLLVTDLEISGLICNLQGCSGCFGTHCICKNSIDCTEKYSFFRGSTGVI